MTDLYKALDEAFPDPSPTPDVEVKAAIERLKEAAEKATPGPWVTRALENFGWNVVHYNNGDKFDLARVSKSADERDAAFIAAANPSTILSLISSYEERGREIERLRETGNDQVERARTAEASLSQAQDRIKSLERIVGKLVRADTEAKPDGYGLCDCVDNSGDHYQSQWLSEVISEARALLSTPKGSDEA